MERHRLTQETKDMMFKLFEEGLGYKMTAKELGLRTYTVRDYRRKYNSGDISWVSERCLKTNDYL